MACFHRTSVTLAPHPHNLLLYNEDNMDCHSLDSPILESSVRSPISESIVRSYKVRQYTSKDRFYIPGYERACVCICIYIYENEYVILTLFLCVCILMHLQMFL